MKQWLTVTRLRYDSKPPYIPAPRPVPLRGTRRRGFQNQSDAIQAAVDIAARDGVRAVTFGKVAATIGRSGSAVFEQFRSVERLRSQVLRAAAQSTVGGAFWAAQWSWGVEALYVFVDAMVQQSGDPASRIMAASPNYAVAEAMIAVLERAADDAAAHGHLKLGIGPANLAAELYIVGQGLAQAKRELGESWIDRQLAPEIFDVYVRDRLTSTGRRRLARQFVEAEFDLNPQSEVFRLFIERVWGRFLKRLGGGP